MNNGEDLSFHSAAMGHDRAPRVEAARPRSLDMDALGIVVVEDCCPGARRARHTEVAAFQHVGNQPIVCHVVDSLVSAGVEKIVVVSSTERAASLRDYLAAHASHPGVELVYVDRPAPLDLSAALSCASPIVGTAPCIVHVAGGLLGDPVGPLLSHVRDDAPDVLVLVHQGPTPYGHLGAATQEMLNVAELDPGRAVLGVAGVFLFGPGALANAASTGWWSDREVDLTGAAQRIVAAGGAFHVRRAHVWCAYAGRSVDLLELNRIVLDRLEDQDPRQESNGNRIEGRVYIDDAASVRASVIVGPTAIAAGARITDAYIGPYTSVGAGARIEGAEVERSIVSAGATIAHIGCRLAGSVIGRDARVLRDFSVPRAMRLSVGDGTEVVLP